MKKSACCLKYFLLLLYILTMSYLRGLLFAVFIATLIYDISKRYKKRILQDILMILIAFSLTLTHYPLFKSADFLRFYLLKGQYDNAANRIALEVQGEDDIYWEKHTAEGLCFLTAEGYILYMKQNGHIAIFFPTNTAFMTGYVYYCDGESRRMFENPAQYFPAHTLENNIYEYYKNISEAWSYVQFY